MSRVEAHTFSQKYEKLLNALKDMTIIYTMRHIMNKIVCVCIWPHYLKLFHSICNKANFKKNP